MLVLGLETTTAHGSIALLRSDQLVGMRRLQARHYGAALFEQVNALLAEAQIGLRDIELFAVADGPGSFTGVRIGLTAVKGWIEVLGAPAVGVSTLRAVAGVGEDARLAALDASRGEVYYGVYPEGEEGVMGLDAFLQRARAFRGGVYTPDANLQAHVPQAKLVSPDLAETVARLGLVQFRTEGGSDALRLDARYIRRSDAELFAAPR